MQIKVLLNTMQLLNHIENDNMRFVLNCACYINVTPIDQLHTGTWYSGTLLQLEPSDNGKSFVSAICCIIVKQQQKQA